MANNNIRRLPSVSHGTTIVVQGQILPHASMFSINLCVGCDFGKCDTALHVNPRYNQGNVVVRNSFLNGSWGAEERGGAPFNVPRGSNIEILILIQNDVIKVAFNGQHYCDFRHRTAKTRITYLVASGDIQIQNVTFFGPGLSLGASSGGFGKPAKPATKPKSSHPISVGQPLYPPPGGYCAPPNISYPAPAGYGVPAAGGYGYPHPATAPGKHFIPGGLYPGRMIYISLVPGPTQFAVNLRLQESGGDIAFHFNPRLQKGVVVRNSNFGGSWGQEELHQTSFPFHPGQLARLIILAEHDKFKVAVNDIHFVEFRHRHGNLAAIQWVEVAADATNVNIHVQ